MGMVFTDSHKYDMAGRRRKKSNPRGEVYKKFQPPPFKPYVAQEVYRRGYDANSLSSCTVDAGVAPRKEPQRYTGTLITGIATMHKSNAVPIINQEEATDIARMRR